MKTILGIVLIALSGYSFYVGYNGFIGMKWVGDTLDTHPVNKILSRIVAPFLLICGLSTSCFNMISPGYVGVVINLFGSQQGIDQKELGVGLHFIPPWKNIYVFPIFEQNITWSTADHDGFNFQTSEGLQVSASVGITFHLEPEKIHTLFCKYRRGMDEISHTFVKNYIRDAINRHASKMKIEDLYGTAKEGFFDEVQKTVQIDLKEMGICISRIYLVGNFTFPQKVVEALNQKIEAIQRAQQRENELRESEAQARKHVAEIEGQAKAQIVQAQAKAKEIELQAIAQANANKLLNNSLTPQLLRSQEISKWDGKLPVYSGTVPIPFMKVN